MAAKLAVNPRLAQAKNPKSSMSLLAAHCDNFNCSILYMRTLITVESHYKSKAVGQQSGPGGLAKS
jgi:hypothetical protein